MEPAIQYVNNLVKDISPDVSLSSILKNMASERKLDKQVPKDYYIVTDLCNPCEAFWKRKRPDIIKSAALRRKLHRGTQLHINSSFWLKGLEGFSNYEGNIDGIYVGLPRVRGKVDYVFDDKILDLKTKGVLPKDAEEIIEKYPQDIEQVAMYSFIYPAKPKENYLLFMEDTPPHNIKAFKILITDFGRIESLIKDRINRLDKALENNDPSRLGGSRYHDDNCFLCKSEVCDCKKIESLSTDSLKKCVTISFDEELTSKINKLKEENNILKEIFTTWNVIAPKEHYKEIVLGKESNYIANEIKSEYNYCLRGLIDQLPNKASKIEVKGVKSHLKEFRLLIGQRWIRKISSNNAKGNLIPYIVKVSELTNRRFIAPHECHIAELGIIASAFGKSSGYIFIVYPYLNDEICVFEVSFDSPESILKNTKEILDLLELAEKNKDDTILPESPDFVNNN